MSLSHEQFIKHWETLPESQEPHAVEAAWRRYQLVQDPSYTSEPEKEDPSASEFRSRFDRFFQNPFVLDHVAEPRFITLPANRIPWTRTGINVDPEQEVSVFATGRVWRSRSLDLWLRPQFALWFKVGINGTVFNLTGSSGTFASSCEGDLYVANQFPGQFGEPASGRPVGQLGVYEKADGRFEILFVVWKKNASARQILEKFQSTSHSVQTGPISQELDRMRRENERPVPQGWSYLWFLGSSSIYSLREYESERCMHCKPYQNVGILQKTFDPPIPFRSIFRGMRVSWDWLVSSLPSRLREDLTISHDYLSIAFEFENHRDLTYTWSWELPKYYGYWCPLPTWADREYHIVLRSGTEELGQWISEERDLYADYVKYVEGGKEDAERMPKQVVKAWFIAGNRWQRFEGEMMVKRLRFKIGPDVLNIL